MNAPAVVAARLPLPTQAPCILVNPRSFAASRDGLAERASAIARSYGAAVLLASDSAQIAAAADAMLERAPEFMIVLSGDGTIRAVADRLASGADDDPRPPLLVLGGGRSNVTPREFGGAGGALRKLEAALRNWRAGIPFVVEERHLLEVAQASAPLRRGFSVTAGLVDYAIRACHRDRSGADGKLGQGWAATTWSVTQVLTAAMRGRLDPRLDDLRVVTPGGVAMAEPAHFLLVTTLQRRQGALYPFAERGQGALRFTAIAARGLGLWRLPWLALGRFRPSMDAAHGYLSGRCDELRVHRLSSYTLDGEEFSADPDLPVAIRRGPRLRFVSL